jgi:hypothetical protein
VANTGLFVFLNVVVQTAVSTAPTADTTTPAPNSALIVFLPLIGAILGAVVGAWANSWYRNREAEKARDEEREGLLILLSMEVSTNNRSLETFLMGLAATPDENRASVAATLGSEAWDESKVRLAQLIPANFLAMLALCYNRIELMRLQWTVPIGESSEYDAERARDIRGNGISVIRAAQRYMSDPESVASMLDEHL